MDSPLTPEQRLAFLFADKAFISHNAAAKFLRLDRRSLAARGDAGLIAYAVNENGARIYSLAAMLDYCASAKKHVREKPNRGRNQTRRASEDKIIANFQARLAEVRSAR